VSAPEIEAAPRRAQMGERSATPDDIPDLRRGTFQGRTRRWLRAVLLLILRPLLRLRIEGLEHVPPDGAVLVVANHLHNADPVLLEIVFPRALHFMAKRELFGLPLIGWIIRRAGAFPVDRGRADRTALRLAQANLDQGIPVGMFPEGTRSPSRRLRPALPGAGLVALRAGVPILPVAITGTERLPLNGTKGQLAAGARPPDPGHAGIRIRFGAPIHLADESGSGKLGVRAATEQMMAAIAALLPPDYRGVYGERPPNPEDDGGPSRFDV